MLIRVTYESIDGYRETRTYKTLKGARRYAQHWLGEHPDIGITGAVDDYGIGKIQVDGDARSADLFPEDETCTHYKAYRRNPHDEFTYWCPTCGFQWNTEDIDEEARNEAGKGAG